MYPLRMILFKNEEPPPTSQPTAAPEWRPTDKGEVKKRGVEEACAEAHANQKTAQTTQSLGKTEGGGLLDTVLSGRRREKAERYK